MFVSCIANSKCYPNT